MSVDGEGSGERSAEEALIEGSDAAVKAAHDAIIKLTGGAELFHDIFLLRLEVVDDAPLILIDLVDRYFVHEALGRSVDDEDLLFERHRCILTLLEELYESLATCELALS